MATKKTGDIPARSNKIRFVLVEADISDGNLSELTSAITNALKPSYPLARPALPRPGAQPVLPAAPNGDEPEVSEPEELEAPEAAGEESDAPTTPKAPRKKSFRPPDYIASIVEGDRGKEFRAFAESKAPKSKNAKYLVAAYWLKDNGHFTANANKVYTLFKTAGWSTGFNDWNQTFHNLVHKEYMRREGDEWSLNPLGEDAVNKGTE
jgi:hypothetical protein